MTAHRAPIWLLALAALSCSAAPDAPSEPEPWAPAGTAGAPPAGGSGGTGPGNGAGGGGAGGGTAGGAGAAAAAGGPGGGAGGSPNTAPGFIDLAPPLGSPLDPAGTPLSPPPPPGWTWHPIEGAICRDGSQNGIYARFTASDRLFVYVEGGGACTNAGFCNYNPAHLGQALSGDGQTVVGSALGVAAARQQPGVFELGIQNGVFDFANPANPLRDWNMVYIPYCTGDVHAGTRTDAAVPGVAAPQQFVGHFNMQKFVSRIVPTFQSRVSRVILGGASAGSYGAALAFSMFQDAFGAVRVDALLDSGPPFADEYMPACMQQRWRETWGLNDALPPDCGECFHADGGGLVVGMASFLLAKHPNSTVALISSLHDEVIRLFFSMGLKSCAAFDTADPVLITAGHLFDPSVYMQAAPYEAGLLDLRARYAGTGRFATYFLGGANATFHQHIWRTRFTDASAGTESIAAFVTHFLDGQLEHVGP